MARSFVSDRGRKNGCSGEDHIFIFKFISSALPAYECLYITCIQCQARSEEGMRYPGTELQIVVSSSMGAGAQIWSSGRTDNALNQRAISPTPIDSGVWCVCFYLSLPLCLDGVVFKSPCKFTSPWYLSYCLSLPSRRYNLTVSWILSYQLQQGMLLLTRKAFFTTDILMLFNICVPHLGYICKNIRT